ncbi:Acyl-CoA synthetase family member [Apis cerana cerana]|uniref:Acyl-CoA synthetase family member n=1 Tax=Apis cerana cerana TaxID=94128 RepID=A0A2A3ER17_APICC|nr:Acyl-CoA synthetase family member [Apis cerana cerana]
MIILIEILIISDKEKENFTFYSNDFKDFTKKLHDICNWSQLDNVAIEYHDLQETIYIHYKELFHIKSMISDYLKHIQNVEFIGINFDIPEYCVISLILGILNSKHSFINIPVDSTEFINLKNYLNLRYLFCTQSNIEGNIVCQFEIHKECIYLIKLKHVQKQIIQNAKQNCYAYAISTSGSTGVPKVIRVLHSCIVPNILDLNKILAITKCDKISQFTNFTFDPSIIEIFLALSNAGTLFMVSKSLKNNPDRLLKVAYSSQITILQITPSVFMYNWSPESLKSSILSNNTSLRAILFGGEPFPKLEVISETMHPYNNTKIYNIYGITEVSCWASINEILITGGQFNVHYLGQVLSHTLLQVRNKRGEVITSGTGFLYIGSNQRVCLVNDENIEDLELPVFRDSGDIVDIDEEGKIFYKGRKNSFIKRFGNKVDLTKLKEFVLQIDFVKNCYVLWDDSYHHLHLPDKIHFMNHIEFTSSGKISLEHSKEHYIQDKITDKIINNIDLQQIEVAFKSIWENNLQRKNIGFVKLGGTSIVALQISNAMSEISNIEFPKLIGMLLMDSTIDECLNYIKSIVLNNQNGIIDLKSHNNIRELPLITVITIEDEKSFRDSNKKNKKYNSTIQVNDIQLCQWYKCRGQVYNYISDINEEFKLQYDTISKVKIQKTYDMRKCVDASPTIFRYSDGKTYATVGSHSGFIFTFELEKECHNPIFKIKLPDRIESSVLILDNFRGIVGCYDGNIYCFHLKTGKFIWNYKTGNVVKNSVTFCKEKGIIFVGSYDCYIYCLSVKDGSEIWKFKFGNGSINASGCLHLQSDTVLFGTLDGFCLALQQLSGKLVWKYKLSDPIFVAPVSLNNGLVLFCSVTGLLCCFDIEVNVKMWTYKINGNIFSYIVKQNDTKYENIILASQNKNLYCLESKDTNFKTKPTLKYVLNFHSPILATPWCENNFLFIACKDGTLNIYNSIKNRVIKIEKLPAEVFSSPVVNNNVIIIGCRDNNVYALELV